MICMVCVLLYLFHELSELDLRNPVYMYLNEALLTACVYCHKMFIELNCSEVFHFMSLSLQIYIIISQNKHTIWFYVIISDLKAGVARVKIEVNARFVCEKEGVAQLAKI